MKKQTILTLFIAFLIWGCSESSDGPIIGELEASNLIDMSYGSDPRQAVDVYLPAGRSKENTPLLIYIHGGAWIEGDKSEFSAFLDLARQAFPDYGFVSIGYRLHDLFLGSNRFPSQENDIIQAITYIESQTATWNVSNNIILVGASAGAHLALLHGYKHQEIGNIAGVIALFPPTDLAKLYSFNQASTLGLMSILGGSPQESPEIYQSSSPVHFIDEASIPSIFFHGTLDQVVPISQSELLAKVLQENGVNHQYRIVEGQGHGFTPQTYQSIFQEAASFMDGIFN